MREITITANDAGRRLDRFLRKYLREASLGEIYRMIRKDVKVDGRRRDQSYMLCEGEVLTLYLADEAIERLTGGVQGGRASDAPGQGRQHTKAKRQFGIIYEDSSILIADKPYGLLTHGDSREKKNHLANQVRDYLIEKAEYDPRSEKVFSPAPANRIDRNTTGLVLFGKTAAALKELNRMIRLDMTDKYYLTIVSGVLDRELTLTGSLVKDEASNRVRVSNIKSGSAGTVPADSPDDASDPGSRDIITVVRPLRVLDAGNGLKVTLTEVKLVTGRPHQIRAHLAGIGHPVMGDSKYAAGTGRDAARLAGFAAQQWGISTQLLHACRIEFREADGCLSYLKGRSFEAPLPGRFSRVLNDLGSNSYRR